MRDGLELLAVRAVTGGFGLLPPAVGRGVGSALGAAVHAAGFRADVVRAQIAAAFPEREDGWVRRTASACYRHFGAEAAVIARLQRRDDARLAASVVLDAAAEERVERMAAGEGTLVVTGHVGNWEVAGAILAARGVPLAAVVKRQKNARFDAWLADTRRRLGIEPIYMEEAMRRIPDLLAAGRSVALVADQDARRRGFVVTFLGRPASTFLGPARLAVRTGAPLVFGFAVREGDGYRASLECVRGRSTPEPVASGAAALDVTRDWVGRLEREVRRAPAQYFWFHRRWKSGAALASRNALAADEVRKTGPDRAHGPDRDPAPSTTRGGSTT